MTKKHLLLIATGGTIASVQTEDGLTPQISARDLLSFVPKASDFVDVTPIQLINLDSTNIEAKHWIQMARAIEAAYEDYDGFVICHGTDTMAYTAAALSYLIQDSPKPIVLTGSQKSINLDSTDARTNLYDSLLFASDDRAHGVNLVFDGKVICGTRAQKERTKSYDAFVSINFPFIAAVQNPHILFYIDDKDRVSREVSFQHDFLEEVGLVKLIPSMKAGSLVKMAEDYRAVIIESFGVGGLPAYETGDFRQAVAEIIRQGKVVVMTTQVPLEGSNMTVYEVGKVAKETWGLMEAYDMTLPATACKLMWILAKTQDPKEVRRLFEKEINHDRLWPGQDME